MCDYAELVKALRCCAEYEGCLKRDRFKSGFTCAHDLLNDAADAIEELLAMLPTREKLIDILSHYFQIGDSYTFELTRVKEAFELGTMSFEDFSEWDEENIADLADWILDKLQKTVKAALLAKDINVPDKNVGRWISVEERLPECGSLCMVLRFDYVTSTPFVDLLWFDGEWWNRIHHGNYAVTHWMPLPELPKEVE